MKKIKAIIYVSTAASSYGVMAALVKLAYAEGFNVAEVLSGQLLVSIILLWGMAFYQLYLKETIALNTEELQLLASDQCFTDFVNDEVKTQLHMNNKKNLIGKKDFLKLFSLGFVGPGLTAIFYYKALSLLPVSMAIFLLFQFSVIAYLIDWLKTKEMPSFFRFLALGSIVLGTIFGLEV